VTKPFGSAHLLRKPFKTPTFNKPPPHQPKEQKPEVEGDDDVVIIEDSNYRRDEVRSATYAELTPPNTSQPLEVPTCRFFYLLAVIVSNAKIASAMDLPDVDIQLEAPFSSKIPVSCSLGV
jgi:hypothetical protein